MAQTESGEYYVYQPKDIQDIDGLKRNLTRKSKKDKFFVTKVIADLAVLAYEVVRDHPINMVSNSMKEEKKKKKKDSDSSEEEDFTDIIKKNRGIVLRTGDVFRMGRVIYRVVESSLDKKRKMINDF